MATRYRPRRNISFRNSTAASRFPNTSAPECLSAYGNLPSPANRIPSPFKTVTSVNSFRYVLYHSWNRIRRLTFFFGAAGFFGAGFSPSWPVKDRKSVVRDRVF